MKIYILDDVVKPSELRSTVASEIRKNAHVTDPKLIFGCGNLKLAVGVLFPKDAGVTDHYWVPPPGWKPGDSPTQDPICARSIKLLKDDISTLKGEEIEKQRAHERYMKLQEQGKTEQARKDLDWIKI